MVHKNGSIPDLNCNYEKIEKIEDRDETEKNDNNVVDDILLELSFGTYQILNYSLVSLVVFAFGLPVFVYIFTALNSEYR